jgi:ferredoxin
MPKKYHVGAQVMPPRFVPVPKYSMIEKEGCLGCLECAKRDCVYDVYKNRDFFPAQMIDSIDYLCQNCLRCIQGCKNQLITKMKNPDFEALGDEYWKPDQIAGLWEQATTGKIPVSGAGYNGPFSGPGFDSMWTDMSEIVRPTRDGIHGREYISTSVNVGRILPRLEFDDNGELYSDPPPLVSVPIPMIFDKLPFGVMNENVHASYVRAAEMVGTMVVVPEQEIDWKLMPHLESIIPLLSSSVFEDDQVKEMVIRSKIVEIEDGPDVLERIEKIKDLHPATVVLIRLPASKQSTERVERLTLDDAEAIHLVTDWQGNEPDDEAPRFIKDVVREVHLNLVDKALRDEVTIVASGGIAMAEHVAKAVICGANLVGIDLVLHIALECRACKRCVRGLSCPVAIEDIDPEWGALRMRNLICSWHSQLIEVLGAMGLREVRRLRGEAGRAMFFEDLEQEAFGDVRVAPKNYNA